MRRGFAIAALVLSLLVTQAVAASEESQRQLARGLVEFHTNRYSEALSLFDRAVSADAGNIDALYYRGVTHGRLNDFKAAVADLRAVLAAQPSYPQAPLDLGVALVQSGANADAVPWLEQAQRTPELNAQASLFLGIAQLRLRQTDAARRNFKTAEAADATLALPARYYAGVAAYQDRDWKPAEDAFAFVTAVSPSSEMGQEAAAFLTKLRQGEASSDQPAYHLYGDVGFQYDSNVVLAPSDDTAKQDLSISKQADGRAVITAGGTYAPWRTEHAELSLGYEFFQSLHFQLTDFDLEDHRAQAQLAFQAGPLRFGMSGRYDFYLLKDSAFLQEATAQPWVQVSEGSFGRTEVDYRMRRRDFLKQPFISVRDAFNHAAGIRQFVYLGAPERYLWAGYEFIREDPINRIGNQFAYDGNQLGGGVGWNLPYAIRTDLSYSFQHDRYAPPSNGRRDEEHHVLFAAEKSLTEHLVLMFAYFGTFNHSNNPDFAYDRHMVSVSLGVRF